MYLPDDKKDKNPVGFEPSMLPGMLDDLIKKC